MEDKTQETLPLAERILDEMAEALIYADRDGIIRRWNRAAETMFGYPAGHALGQSLDLIIPENLRAAHWRGFNAAMLSGATRLHGRPTLTRASHRSGSRLYVEMSFALVADESGTAVGSVAVARDVTERVEREKAEARRTANP
ncbi:PAS domain S-box protein [Aromatoleum toluvorans]|uniref:PAS domain S-box protein n=1 Tax=Aromatoleum toluvorans TaxID=92002 RepID=A0ABX1Q3K6_9RHOO|nr:PAS domain S-box protein [Aromatoleum toluvorans]NMG46306.1 PAS domain S-box protein [Aromatoleum toluvorans]